jgi:hypothetical protein
MASRSWCEIWLLKTAVIDGPLIDACLIKSKSFFCRSAASIPHVSGAV